MKYRATIQIEFEADSLAEAEQDVQDLCEQLMNSNRNNVLDAEPKLVRTADHRPYPINKSG